MSGVRSVCATVALLAVAGRAAGQPAPLTLRQAVAIGVARYPSVSAAQADQAAAAATIDLARQAYRPRIDGIVQLNRATHANVAGLLLPQSVIAPISGPVQTDLSGGSVWGTAVGALVTWKPFDFGARRADVVAAQREDEVMRVAVDRVTLDTAAAIADLFVSALAGRETVVAAQAAVARAGTLLQSVQALVDAGLRPGVDAATARAEQAAAVMQVIAAQRAADASATHLAEYVGAEATAAALPPPPLDEPAGGQHPSSPDRNPAVRERQAAVDEASTLLEIARRSADPDVAVQGTVYGRGTGVLDTTASGTGADGLGLDAANWAVGLTVTVPMLEWANKHTREAIQAARIKAATARLDEARLDLTRRRAIAAQEATAAVSLARQAPLLVQAARAAEEQAASRYRAGLSSITDVADAERRLAQAEIDAALADLAVWRARLARAALGADSVETFLRAIPGAP